MAKSLRTQLAEQLKQLEKAYAAASQAGNDEYAADLLERIYDTASELRYLEAGLTFDLSGI